MNFVAAFEARWRVQHPLPPYRSGDAERLSRARFLRSGGRTRLGCRVEHLAQRSALKGLRRDAEGSLRDAGAPRANGTSTPGIHPRLTKPQVRNACCAPSLPSHRQEKSKHQPRPQIKPCECAQRGDEVGRLCLKVRPCRRTVRWGNARCHQARGSCLRRRSRW